MSQPKRILFLTGTRADFGKLKSLICAVEEAEGFEGTIFVTGMHTLDLYGHTVDEVYKAGFRHIQVFGNQSLGDPMEVVLASTILRLSEFVHKYPPDMLVVHGDRVEAMAGALVGALRNILVGHIEGGELSGTVDELMRHAISKLAHVHFVANDEAKGRLIQLGELPETVFVIGSPDIDVMRSDKLEPIEKVKRYYDIEFDNFAVAMFHPVTTEVGHIERYAADYVEALIRSGRNYVLIYPNNDEGSAAILNAVARVEDHPRFRVFPSIRFEYFLTLFKHAEFIVGNSSAGIREAPFYGLPTVNIGTRQNNRFKHTSIVDVGYGIDDILAGIDLALGMAHVAPSMHFGAGNSGEHFLRILREPKTWMIARQKQFNDIISPNVDAPASSGTGLVGRGLVGSANV